MDVWWTCLDLNLTHLLIFSAGIPFEQRVLSCLSAVTRGVSFLTFKLESPVKLRCPALGSSVRFYFFMTFFLPVQYQIRRLFINFPCSLSSDGLANQDSLIDTDSLLCVPIGPWELSLRERMSWEAQICVLVLHLQWKSCCMIKLCWLS